MNNLPIDVISNIFDFLPTNKFTDLKLIDKYFNEKYNIKIIIKINKIQNFYKKNRLWYSYGNDLPYFMGYTRYRRFVNLLNRNLYYRKLVLWGDEINFKKIPEQIISRLPYECSRYIIIKNRIDINLSSNFQERKRSGILKFLKFNRISIRECMSAGI